MRSAPHGNEQELESHAARSRLLLRRAGSLYTIDTRSAIQPPEVLQGSALVLVSLESQWGEGNILSLTAKLSSAQHLESLGSRTPPTNVVRCQVTGLTQARGVAGIDTV